MNKDLKVLIAEYVEKHGVEKATSNSIKGIKPLLVAIAKDNEDKEGMLIAAKLKFSIIEYLYFHEDTEKEAAKLLKSVLNDI